MELITTLATVPAVIALVTLAKDLGLPSRLSPLLAVLLGVALSLFDGFALGMEFNTQSVLSSIGIGVILGLSASGLYDGAKAVGTASRGKHALPEEAPPAVL